MGAAEFYTLADGVPCPITQEQWIRERAQGVHTLYETVFNVSSRAEIRIVTFFTGHDSSDHVGKPCLFETRVYGGDLDGESYRAWDMDEADDHHRKALKSVMSKNRLTRRRPHVRGSSFAERYAD